MNESHNERNRRWVNAREVAFIDPNDPNNLILGQGQKPDGTWAHVGISYADLRHLMHVTGPMGCGKTEWIKFSLLAGLFRAQAGFMAMDCKGTSLITTTLPLIPLDREKDVTIVEFDGTTVTGEDLRTTMNLLDPAFVRTLGLTNEQVARIIVNSIPTLNPVQQETSLVLQQIAYMGVVAILEGEAYPTLLHLTRFMNDKVYRAEVLGRVQDADVKTFWECEETSRARTIMHARLTAFLAHAELSSMLIAPGCTVNMRQLMDNRGILLAGISPKVGEAGPFIGMLLLAQMLLAALSRADVPEYERPDWPCIIDEAQVVLRQNPELTSIICTQLRAYHIGPVVIYQSGGILPTLAGNTQNRIILGAEQDDAARYSDTYAAQDLSAGDFVNMARFEHQYMQLHGEQNLFLARMNDLVRPVQEDVPPCNADWHVVTAPAANASDIAIDAAIAQSREFARANRDGAVQRLGQMCKEDAGAFAAYCARTKAHRQAQRQFIIAHPGCIPQKEERIRVLSALGSGMPKLELDAWSWAIEGVKP